MMLFSLKLSTRRSLVLTIARSHRDAIQPKEVGKVFIGKSQPLQPKPVVVDPNKIRLKTAIFLNFVEMEHSYVTN